MSVVTENTVAIKSEAENRVITDLRGYDCSGIKKVWNNEKLTVIVFDCNGDPVWDMVDDDKLESSWDDVYVCETNYGDDDGYWTQINKKECETTGFKSELTEDETLLDWVKAVLSEKEAREVEQFIEYTI